MGNATECKVLIDATVSIDCDYSPLRRENSARQLSRNIASILLLPVIISIRGRGNIAGPEKRRVSKPLRCAPSSGDNGLRQRSRQKEQFRQTRQICIGWGDETGIGYEDARTLRALVVRMVTGGSQQITQGVAGHIYAIADAMGKFEMRKFAVRKYTLLRELAASILRTACPL